jgi:hypothetical protein
MPKLTYPPGVALSRREQADGSERSRQGGGGGKRRKQNCGQGVDSWPPSHVAAEVSRCSASNELGHLFGLLETCEVDTSPNSRPLRGRLRLGGLATVEHQVRSQADLRSGSPLFPKPGSIHLASGLGLVTGHGGAYCGLMNILLSEAVDIGCAENHCQRGGQVAAGFVNTVESTDFRRSGRA